MPARPPLVTRVTPAVIVPGAVVDVTTLMACTASRKIAMSRVAADETMQLTESALEQQGLQSVYKASFATVETTVVERIMNGEHCICL